MHYSPNSKTSQSRPRSLKLDHYNNFLMDAYISKELKTKEDEYTSTSPFSLVVLTWNAAGLAPSGDLTSWIGSTNKRFAVKVASPDFLVFGLQEMCGLSKLLGDQNREQEWAVYLKQQIWATFEEEYVMVLDK